MQNLAEPVEVSGEKSSTVSPLEARRNHLSESAVLPVSVIVPVRNEARNLPRCLESLRDAGEIYIVDSHSTDETANIARAFNATVVQFHYRGGWPKKRQWALETLQALEHSERFQQ